MISIKFWFKPSCKHKQKLDFAQQIFWGKNTETFDCQKAEECKRIYYAWNQLDWTHNFYLFTDSFIKPKTSNRTTILDSILGYVFIATTIPLCKLQTFKVKALQFITHCFLRQEKFGAAEVAGKFTIHFACSKLCLKCTNGYNVQARLWCRNLLLQEQTHRQEAELRLSLQ